MTDVTTSMETAATADPRARRSARRGWRRVLVALGLGLPAILIVHHETALEMVDTWGRTATYKHAWLVLPTLAYLIWHHRRRLGPLGPTGSVMGVAAAALCALLWVASDLLNVAEGRQLALVAAIAAIVLAATGLTVFRALAPLLLLLVFLVPTGGFLIPPLKVVTVAFIEAFARVSGLPVTNDGFAVIVDGQRYVVIDACAGLPYLLTGLFIGLTLALLNYRRWRKILGFTLFAGVLAILANGARVIGIVAYDHANGTKLSLAEHTYFELPAIAVSFIILFVVFALLRPEKAEDAGASRPRVARRVGRKQGGAVLAAVLLVAAGPLLWWQASGDADAAAGATLPESLSAWVKQDAAMPDWQPSAGADADAAALGAYALGAESIGIFIVEARSARHKIAGGATNLAGGGEWMPASRDRIEACGPALCFAVRHTKVLLRESQRVRHVYATHAVGTEATGSLLMFRLYRAWARLTGSHAPARLIAIASERSDGLSAPEIGALLEALTAAPAGA